MYDLGGGLFKRDDENPDDEDNSKYSDEDEPEIDDNELEEIYQESYSVENEGNLEYKEREYDENYEDDSEKEEFDNSFKEIVRGEYVSILTSFADTYLKRIVKEDKKPSTTKAILKIKSDLNGYIERDNFNSLPHRLKNAYKRLNELVEFVINGDSDSLVSQNNILEGLIELSDSCYVYSEKIRFMGERNPCRVPQIELYQLIEDAELELGEIELTKKAKGMLNVCKYCPHRF